jgi:hypothetical protein
MTKEEAKIFSSKYYDFYEKLGEVDSILLQNDYKTTYKFYHYTSIEKFHNIVDNCEFWAHNTRFSNDSTEERGVSERFLKENNYIGDNYFICLCANGDLLSQWRGYCSNGGVSIELSFPEKEMNFTILGNNVPNVLNIYSSPLPISYTNILNGGGDLHSQLKKNLDFLPLIKNGYFSEEQEYRILFKNIDHFFDKCIFERNLDNSTRVPYLRVVFNRNGDLKDRKFLTFTDQTYEKIKKKAINVEGNHFLTISSNKKQESIYNDILAKLDEYYKNKEITPEDKRDSVTILCEGKPPITEIKIAPMYDQERVREQIEHLCKTRYWLKNVPVVCSKIPYTNSLGKK